MGENAEMWEDLANAERTVSTLNVMDPSVTLARKVSLGLQDLQK